MDKRIFQSLADKLHDVLWHEEGEVSLNILRGLAKGRPVSIDYLASVTNMSHKTVKKEVIL